MFRGIHGDGLGFKYTNFTGEKIKLLFWKLNYRFLCQPFFVFVINIG
jgi:hypothetical protein